MLTRNRVGLGLLLAVVVQSSAFAGNYAWRRVDGRVGTGKVARAKSRPIVSDFSYGIESPFDNVHGADDRKRIKDTTKYPYRMIGRLAMGCTGTLIGPRHVLTAGHCVYDTKKQMWRKNLEFSPARDADDYPYGTIGWEHVYAPEEWTKNHSKGHDYALVILSKNIGQSLGWLGYTSAEAGDVAITGYPGDKIKGTMWRTECAVKVASATYYRYQCDSAGGMSGSAVVGEGQEVDLTIFGIHAYGGLTSNQATRVTEDVFDNLTEWKALHR